MKNYEVAVLGGGFSGLVSAIILSEFFGGENVLVLEKNDRVGKKILATGNGRGNVTNSDVSVENYHSSGVMTDVANTLEKYGNKSIIAFFARWACLSRRTATGFIPRVCRLIRCSIPCARNSNILKRI